MTNKKLTNTINLLKVSQALQDKEAVKLVKQIISLHYNRIVPIINSQEVINHIFSILQSSQQPKISVASLKLAIEEIKNQKLYSQENQDFYEAYLEYKKIKKTKYYFDLLEQDIVGQKILDFGCGNGYLSDYLINKGYQVTGADTVKYHQVKELQFIKINNLEDVKKIAKHDTTLVITVLHHINDQYILPILKELTKVTRKIIIIEDSYDLVDIKSTDPQERAITQQLHQLPIKSKFNAIILTDFYGNIIAQNLTEINFSFQFKKVKTWEQILIQAGFKDIEITPIGFPKVSFHGFSQVKITATTTAVDH